MRRICTICARGGSKGVPGKNLRRVAGKPLIAHSIEQARRSGLFAHIAVSSDDPEILRVATDWGSDLAVPRPAELASDVAPKVPAIRHCVAAAEAAFGASYETVVDLDATSPLRNAGDIRGAVELLERGDADNVVTATTARHSPYFNLVELDELGRVRLAKRLEPPIFRRQDAPASFDLNASIYAWRRDALMNGAPGAIGSNTRLYLMPQERSFDIDSEFDLRIVDILLRENG